MNLYNVLLNKQEGVTHFERLFMKHISGGSEKVLEGVPPLTFKSKGDPLIDWTIYGANGGVGDKTANLFDTNSTRYQMGKAPDNKISPYAGGAMFYISATPNTNYTIKVHTIGELLRYSLTKVPSVV